MEIFIGIIFFICWLAPTIFIVRQVIQYYKGETSPDWKREPLYLKTSELGVSYEKMILFFIFNAIAQVGGSFFVFTNTKFQNLQAAFLWHILPNTIAIVISYNAIKYSHNIKKIEQDAKNKEEEESRLKKEKQKKSREARKKNLIKKYGQKDGTMIFNGKISESEFLRKKDLYKKYGDNIGEKIFDKELFLDMTEEMLLDALGDPSDKKETVIRRKVTKKCYLDI